MGYKDVAAEWFLVSEEKLRAASLFEELGHHDKAAEVYLKAGSSLDAAAHFVKAGHHDRTAEIYEKPVPISESWRAKLSAIRRKSPAFSKAWPGKERDLVGLQLLDCESGDLLEGGADLRRQYGGVATY